MFEFGQRIDGISYEARPGAYAIVINADGKVAIMKTSSGFFLPGGGIEQNETTETALVREVREECGWEVIILDKVAEAVQYVHAPGEGFFAKQCFFYRCSIHGRAASPVEYDHQTLWLEIAEARKRLTHESQSWAIAQAICT
jgi:8-oxo-dGTP pyrophosphatase MutT (NUDIX family)